MAKGSEVNKNNCVPKERYEQLKEENKLLKEEVAILSDTKLVKDLKDSMERMKKGEFLTEKEFFEDL